jgi:hypothetical protein
MLVATIVGQRAVTDALWQPDPPGDPSRYPLPEADDVFLRLHEGPGEVAVV